MKKSVLVTLLVLAIPAAAEITQKDILLKHSKTSGDFTIAVANAMPADGYTFRPVPEEMSFGELMAHIAALAATPALMRAGSHRLLCHPKSRSG